MGRVSSMFGISTSGTRAIPDPKGGRRIQGRTTSTDDSPRPGSRREYSPKEGRTSAAWGCTHRDPRGAPLLALGRLSPTGLSPSATDHRAAFGSRNRGYSQGGRPRRPARNAEIRTEPEVRGGGSAQNPFRAPESEMNARSIGTAPVSRDHHYVPQFYLRGWSDNDVDIYAYRIVVSDQRVPPWARRAIKGIAYQPHLYTSELSPEVDEFEKWLKTDF
jgi:hypothetical protein